MSTNIGDEVKAVRKLHPSWSFEQSWHHVMALNPELETSSVESNRVTAKLTPQLEREKWKTEARIETDARALMAKDPRLPFGVALVRAREQSSGGGMYLVTAQHAISLDGALPASIQYMPAGKAKIRPNVNGTPKEITVNVTSVTAARLQADLKKLLSENVGPFVDFDP